MRRSLWWLIIAAAFAIFFGLIGTASGIGAFDSVAGMLWMVAIVAGIASIPIWHRILPEVPAMDGLFKRPASHERWCIACGTPAPKMDECTVCGHAPKPPKPPRERKPKASKKAAKR